MCGEPTGSGECIQDCILSNVNICLSQQLNDEMDEYSEINHLCPNNTLEIDYNPEEIILNAEEKHPLIIINPIKNELEEPNPEL